MIFKNIYKTYKHKNHIPGCESEGSPHLLYLPLSFHRPRPKVQAAVAKHGNRQMRRRCLPLCRRVSEGTEIFLTWGSLSQVAFPLVSKGTSAAPRRTCRYGISIASQDGDLRGRTSRYGISVASKDGDLRAGSAGTGFQ